jgi:hypothetical protein
LLQLACCSAKRGAGGGGDATMQGIDAAVLAG